MGDVEFKSHEVKVQIPHELKNILGIEEEYIVIGPERNKNLYRNSPCEILT